MLREMLSNVARHAHASRVEVTAAADDDTVWIEVTDDGVGPDHEPSTTGSGLGLKNLAAREWDGSAAPSAWPDGRAEGPWRRPGIGAV